MLFLFKHRRVQYMGIWHGAHKNVKITSGQMGMFEGFRASDFKCWNGSICASYKKSVFTYMAFGGWSISNVFIYHSADFVEDDN